MRDSSVGSMRALDAGLERAYRRFGWRKLVLGYIVLAWCAADLGAGLFAVAIANGARVPFAGLLRGLVALVLASVVGAVAGVLGTDRRLRPLRILDTDRPVDGATWQAAIQIPVAAARWNLLVGFVVGPTLAPFFFREVIPEGPILPGLALLPAAGVVAGLAGVFGLQVLMRPILRDLATRAERPFGYVQLSSVRRKLFYAGPAITLALVVVGVAAGVQQGSSLVRATLIGLVTAAVTAIVAIPVAMQLTWSVLQPLDDLVDATERLKAGDFSKPVPELSGDEYGALARSFNEAMEGLAERKRLADENVELLEEVKASRARMVAASDAERRRIERNIHDGAQQRLVALGYDLRLLEMRAQTEGAEEIRVMAETAAKSLKEALDDMRDLARGLHPSVLTTDGLRPAVEQLASLCPVPVTIDVPPDRFDPAVETTAYFVVAEALTNVAKYAHATRAEVRVRSISSAVDVAVHDDGIGGAAPQPASGLAGLTDRVEALDGTLSISSPPGGGTTITASVPLGAGAS